MSEADVLTPAPGPSGEALTGSVGFLLSKLGVGSARRFAERLRPLGIEPRHLALLQMVAASEGRSQQVLGEALAVPASRMVALVDDLEQRGLVERRLNPDDRRMRALHLTKKGRGLLERALAIAAEHESELCGPLEPAERAQFLALLRRLAAGQGGPLGVPPGLGCPAEPPREP